MATDIWGDTTQAGGEKNGERVADDQPATDQPATTTPPAESELESTEFSTTLDASNILSSIDAAEFFAPGCDRKYAVHHGDCITHLPTIPAACVDFSIQSVPFPSMFSYTSLPSDIGNSEDLQDETKIHFAWYFKQLTRVMKPGRVVVIHCMQIPRMKRAGGEGLFDFRGLLIRIGERAGLIFEFDWMVRKNPQAQAIRTRSRELQFAGLESDRANSRGTLCDYLLKFRAPGQNAVPITSSAQVSRNDWISWAEGFWHDIKETDTLNVKEGRAESDTRHICPLQLQTIDRCVRMFSNPGEIVHSSFTGIGSEGFIAVKLGRRFYGCELKDEYYRAALVNLRRAEQANAPERMLF